jgi:predicted RNase H-like HicB family nuclease
MLEMEFTIRSFEFADGTVLSEITELPGCVAIADDIDDLRDKIGETMAHCLDKGQHPAAVAIRTRLI